MSKKSKKSSSKQRWQVGDVVRLKSGGPEMTVNSLPSGESDEWCYCAWFGHDWSEHKYAEFNNAALEKVEE